jgi:hypothetical protein
MDSYASEPFFNNTSESLLVPALDKNFIRRAEEVVSGEANTFFVKSNPPAPTTPRNVVRVPAELVHAVLEEGGRVEGHMLG